MPFNPLKLGGKNTKFFFIGFATLLVIALLVLAVLPPSEPSTAQGIPTNTNAQQTTLTNNEPPIINNPTATPAASVSSSPTPQALPEVTVWQAVFVKNVDGSTYWVNAPKPFALAQLWGSSNNDASNFTQVESVQNNIYMKSNVANVASWTLSLQETIVVKNLAGVPVYTVAQMATVNANGQVLPVNQNIWATGATFSAYDMQVILKQSPGMYYFTIVLSNINLTLNLANGQTLVLSASSGSSQNTLNWLIEIT